MVSHLLILLVPLIFANCLHMVVVKKDWLPLLAQPISVHFFGANKTFRGFLLLPLFNAAAVTLASTSSFVSTTISPFWLGAALGLAYMLFELPNSFLKRRMGILPGESATSNKLLFLLLDKTDSAFGVCLVYYFLSDIQLFQIILLFLVSSCVHMLFSYLLVSLNYKKSF